MRSVNRQGLDTLKNKLQKCKSGGKSQAAIINLAWSIDPILENEEVMAKNWTTIKEEHHDRISGIATFISMSFKTLEECHHVKNCKPNISDIFKTLSLKNRHIRYTTKDTDVLPSSLMSVFKDVMDAEEDIPEDPIEKVKWEFTKSLENLVKKK